MKKNTCFSSLLAFALRALCLISLVFAGSKAMAQNYEPFANATSTAWGSAYNAGEMLARTTNSSGTVVSLGQTNASGALYTWVDANAQYSATNNLLNNIKIVSGSLTYPGLKTSGGNMIRFNTNTDLTVTGGQGGAARIHCSNPADSTAGDVWYASFVLKVTDLTGLTNSSSGVVMLGFNNSLGTTINTTLPTTILTRFFIRTNQASVAGAYDIGIGKHATGALDTGANWFGTHFTASDTVFVVIKYEIVSSTANDVVKMWVNPSVANFGAGSDPTPDITVPISGTTDAGLASFVLMDRVGVPRGCFLDDLRIDRTWANVTPGIPAITSQPTSVSSAVGTTANFSVTASAPTVAPITGYQWYKGGNALSNTGNISGSTSSALTVSSVSAGDADSYTVVVSNANGSTTSSVATLTTYDAPTITTQPAPRTDNAGSTSTFSVVASSLFNTYQWRSNGVDLANGGSVSGATSSTLTLSSVLKAFEATYTVFVSNSVGTVTSDGAATLTVIDPVITSQPVSLTRNATQGASFSVGAAGTATLTYQWRHNGSNISGATDSSYTIASVADADAGSYDVGVTNGVGGALSSVATLTVIDPPSIGTQPSSQTVGEGTNATFSVSASGTSPSYQWRKGTSILSNGSHISGATTANLTLTGVSSADAGNYNVVLNNAAGTVTSSDGVLTVIIPPTITAQPANAVVTAGSTTNFSVTATGTSLNYQWQKGGVNISDTGVYSGTASSSLTLTSVTAGDAGSYRVIISNSAGTATSATATLIVAAQPVIVTQPTNNAAGAGQTVYFAVSVTGADPLSYQWNYDSGSGPTALSDTGIVSGSSTAILTLTGVYAANAGSYFLVVTNSVGSATSSNGVLTVTDPYIGTQPSSSTTGAGSNAVFTVSATGTPTVTYQWQKGGVNLSNTGNITGSTSTSLTVAGVNQTDAGSYTVVVTGLATQTSSTATLTVVDPPIISADPSGQTVNATSNVVFTVALSQGTSPTYQWRKGGVNVSNGGKVSGATTSSLTITNALYADIGSYSVVVANAAASVTSADAVLVVNDPAIVSQPASRSSATGSTATFSVTAVGTATITYQWRKNGSNLSNTGNVTGATSATLSLATVTNSNDDGTYSVVVTGAGGSVTSTDATLTTIDAPTITSNPANTTSFISSNVVLTVGATGPSLSYIWRKNVTNILSDGGSYSGATTASLTISNLQFSDAASYSCIVSNVVGTKTTPGGTGILKVFANFPITETFNYSVGNLENNVAPNNLAWAPVGTNGTEGAVDIQVTNINLSVNGLPSSSGKAVRLKNTTGPGDRLQIPSQTNGTVYASFIMKVEDITSLATTTGGVFIGGFNNSTGTQVGQATVVAPKLYLRKSGSNYQIGTGKNDSTSTTYDSTLRSVNDVVFIVMAYTFGTPGTVDDSVAMWINPASSTFGAASAPASTLSVAPNLGTDIASDVINSFFIAQRSTSQPNLTVIDELRMGLSWADVTPAAAPSITSQPNSRTNVAGTTATFTATVTGADTITYQWRKNGSNLTDGDNVSGSTTASLVLTGVQASDAASYSLYVSNRVGTATSSDAVLHVSPAITSQPVSASVNYSSNTTFTVVAAGEATLTYQWQKGGVNIGNGGDITGATTDTLSISGVVGADAGSYAVVVSNPYGSATSSTVILTVADPVIYTQPSSSTVGAGSNAVFSVVAQGTSLGYQWKKAGSPLSDGAHISGATSASLTIIGVSDPDADNYSVDVTGTTTLSSSSASLTVVDPPDINTQPQSTTANAGTSATFTVAATSPASLTYQWKKNGISLSDGGNIAGATTSSLTVSSLLHADQASYSVDVTGYTTTTSDNAVLTVIDPVVSNPVGGSVNKGSTFVLSVTGAGTGAGPGGAPSATFKYQWYFKGTNATAVNYVKQAGKTNTTLTIAASSFAVEGNYFCTVTNAYSKDQYPGTNVAHSAAAYVTVNYPITSVPVVPATATKTAGNNIVYTAIPTATATKPFSYQWVLNGVNLTDDGIHIIGATANKLSINDVQAPDAGTYQCTVQNASGSVTSLNTQGILTVNPDSVKPVSLIMSPTPNARLTNDVTTTTNNVTTAVLTAPNFVLTGKAVDNGLVSDVSVTQQYFDTAGVLQTLSPVSVTLIGSLPGLKTWTNNFVLHDGTNIFTAVATDSGTNHTTSVARKFFLVRTNTLTVNDVSADTFGTGTDTPGTIPAAKFGFGQAANGAALEVGRKYTIKGIAGFGCFCTNITDGAATVLASGSVGLNPTATFIMKDGEVINVNFATNPIVAAGVAGSYNGLYVEASGATVRSAGFSLITVKTNLSFSGSTKIDGRTFGVSGKFNLSGDATATVNRLPKGLSNLVMTLHLDWVGSTKQITGTVTNTDPADPWVSYLTNDLAGQYTGQDARYTAVVPPGPGAPTSAPGGYGSLVITNNALGKMLMLAPSKMGDGVLVSQVVDVSKDGNAPVFVQLYKDTSGVFDGIFQGWLHFDKTGGTVSGSMNHIRTGAAPAALPAVYTGGFSNLNDTVTGAIYAPPAAGTRALTLTGNQCTFTVTDCNLGTDSTLTWVLSLSTGNAFTRVSGATNKISGTITGPTGAFSISFLPTGVGPAGSLTLKSVTGVVQQTDSTGKGIYTGSGQTAAGVITP